MIDHTKPIEQVVCSWQSPIKWGDMDALNHMNNSVYFKYMEEARIQWLLSLGFEISGEGQGPVIINASCTYLRPVLYPSVLEVKMGLGNPGRSSVDTFYDIFVVGGEERMAYGQSKVVWVDYDAGKSVELPSWVRSACS